MRRDANASPFLKGILIHQHPNEPTSNVSPPSFSQNKGVNLLQVHNPAAIIGAKGVPNRRGEEKSETVKVRT
jgi:hypothetical protein